jgi:hypothetical protein
VPNEEHRLKGYMENLGKVRAGMSTGTLREDDDEMLTILEEGGYDEKYTRTKMMCAPNLDAAYEATKRFAFFSPKNYDTGLWNCAWDMVFLHLLPIMGNSRVMSFEEVEPTIDRSKHPGWPWVHRYANKGAYMDGERDKYIPQFWALLAQGNIETLQAEMLKKELRPVDKIEKNRLRTIIMMCVNHVIAHKRLCQDQFRKLESAGWRKTMMALGFTPYRGGAQQLYTHLAGEEGKCGGWEFDVSKMDSTLTADVFGKIAELFWLSLRQEDRTTDNLVRMNRIHELIHNAALIMQDGEVNQKRHGNSSGQFGTAVHNTIWLLFLKFYSFLKLCGIQNESGRWCPRRNLDIFKDEVNTIGMGDDWTYTTYNADYNGVKVAEILYTDFGVMLETPSEAIRHAADLRFLAFGFKYSEEQRAVLFTISGDNIYSSILQGGVGDMTPQYKLERLMGIRNSTWGDPDLREMVSYLIHKYINKWDGKLGNADPGSGWERVKSMFKTDYELEKLYTGRQTTNFLKVLVLSDGDKSKI